MTQDAPVEGDPLSDPPGTAGYRDPGPVPATGRANFRGLPNLVGRDKDSARAVAVLLLLIALGFPAVVVLTRPAATAHAFGVSEPVIATVESVSERPRSRRGREPSWTVEVSWAQDGVERNGSGVLRGAEQPAQLGDRLSGAADGDGPDVSFDSTADDRALVFGILASSLASGIGGVVLFRRSGTRRKLLRVVGRTPPRRAVVRAVDPNPFVWDDVGPRRVVSVVEYDLARAVEHSAGTRADGNLVLRSGEVDTLDPGDVIDIWANTGRGEQLVAVRRASDGTWWVGRSRGLTG